MKSLFLAIKRSLPTRILLVFIITSLLITVVIFSLVVHGFAGQWRNNVSPHLAQYLDYVNADIGNPPDLSRAKELATELPINIYIAGPDINFSSTGAPLDLGDLEFDDDHEHHRKRYRRTWDRDNDSTIKFGSHRDRTVLLNEITPYKIYYELAHRGKREHRDNIIGKILLGILGLLCLCYLVFHRMLRPVRDIKLGVKRMGKGELGYRVPVRADNDLGELATNINTMADDIEKMLDAKRQLLLGVSHELRSPLTRANIAVQLMDDTAHTQQIREDLNEMDSLITEILETERINTSHAVIHRSQFDLVSVAKSVIADMGLKDIQLGSDTDSIAVDLDEPRIRLLLRNMLSNAAKHGGDAADNPVLQLSRDERTVVIEMIDFGAGIPAEHLKQVTEPFYRADPSRTRSTGGFGIGLYLCKLIAEAHQGELLISSEAGKGTRVKALLADAS